MPEKKTVPRVCAQCGAPFLAAPRHVRYGKAKFCSRGCATKHNPRKLPSAFLGRQGAENPSWKGGVTISPKGYVYILMPEHPNAQKSGYIKRATLILEKKLGRYLQHGEFAHHKDEDKQNDSPDNLEPMFNAGHTSLHNPKTMTIVRQPNHPANRRYVWPSDEALLEMHRTKSLREIARVIGCTHRSVDRKIKKLPGVAQW